MKVTFGVTPGSLEDTISSIAGVMINVNNGVKWATEVACASIYEASIEQVPKDTYTLAESAFWKVERRTELSSKSYRYRGIVGYGGNGDPINPKNGKHASQYAAEVHEDLSVPHRNGKAKFLEDPLREFAEGGELYKLYLSAVKRGLNRRR